MVVADIEASIKSLRGSAAADGGDDEADLRTKTITAPASEAEIAAFGLLAPPVGRFAAPGSITPQGSATGPSIVPRLACSLAPSHRAAPCPSCAVCPAWCPQLATR